MEVVQNSQKFQVGKQMLYRDTGYCGTGVQNIQKFGVRVWISDRTTHKSSGHGMEVPQNSQKFRGGIRMLYRYPGYCGTEIHNLQQLRVRL